MLNALIPRWLISLLFRSFEAKDAFLTQVEELRARNPDKPIAFAAFGAGYFELLLLRGFLKDRFGEAFEVRKATRLSSLWLDGFGLLMQRFLYLFRLAKRPPSRIKQISDELKAGRPVLLCFEGLERSRVFQTPLGEIELGYLAEQVPDLLVVPTVFVWRRKRRMEEGENQDFGKKILKNFVAPFTSPVNLLLGDPYQPTDLRKFFILIRQYGRSAARLAPEIPIRDLAPKILRRKVITTIQQEKRIILGPTFRSTKMVGEAIFRSPSFQKFARRIAAEEGTSEVAILKRASKYFHEMSALFSYFTFEWATWVLHKLFGLVYEEVSVDDKDFETIRAASREGTLLYIPNHRSYADFLLLSYLLFRKELLPPHVAAGQNLNIPIFGTIFKQGGAFFIRRSFRGNPLYAEVVKRYIGELLANRVSVEFFIEGTRSRNGKMAPPKFGMLKMVMDSILEGHVSEKVRIIPVALTYERLTEESSHKRELEGGKKVNESALGVLKASKVLFKKHGRVHVRIGEPILFEDALKQFLGEGAHSIDTKKLAVQKIAFEVCHRINRATLVTNFGVVCALLLARPGAAMPRKEVDQWLLKIEKDLRSLGAPLTPEMDQAFLWSCQRAITSLLNDGILKPYNGPTGDVGLKVVEKQVLRALLYKNSFVQAVTIAGIAGLARKDRALLLEFRNLLQFEFFFAEKDQFLKSILALPVGLSIGLYAFMLDDVLENICISLRGLMSMQGLTLESREWKSRLLKYAQGLIEERGVARLEAVNTQSFSAFVDMAQNKGWLKKSVGHSERDLHSPMKAADLEQVLNRIKGLRPDPNSWSLEA
jgi:glycerol-3-phosphate O-acyltransferase